MLNEIFTSLTMALEGSAAIALLASLVWGVLSIVLSPCHLASIPLVVGLVNSQEGKKMGRAVVTSLVFSLGILLTIALIGVFTGLAGRLLGDMGAFNQIATILVTVVLFVFGLYMLGVIKFSFNNKLLKKQFKGEGLVATFVMGVLFGLSVGPCTFAYMAPMLAVTFKAATSNLYFAIALILFFAIGHCFIIVLAGVFSGLLQRYKNWGEKTKAVIFIRKICGVLLVVAAVYMIFSL